MAWSFDGTNDYGQASLQLSGSPLVTFACWFYWDSYANDDDLLVEYGATNYATSNGFIIDPNSGYSTSSGKFAVGFYTTGNVWYYFTRPSAAAWHHLMVTFDKNTSTQADKLKAWIDGAAQTMTVTENLGAGGGSMGNTALNVMCRDGASLFGAGDVAEMAIWGGVLLDTSHALQLAAGYSPLLVKKPRHYWRMIGNSDPDSDVTMNNQSEINVTGPTKAAHPRIIYPAPMLDRRFKPAAAVTTRGMTFGHRGTAFNGGRCLQGILQ